MHENKKCLINQREVHTHTDVVQGRAARRAARGSRTSSWSARCATSRPSRSRSRPPKPATSCSARCTRRPRRRRSTAIIDQFPADRQAQIRVMLSESLRGVIAQTLCRKIGGGRVAALEVLIVTPAVSNLIREGKTFQIPSMMQVGKAVGMVSAERRADGAGDARSWSRRKRPTPRASTRRGWKDSTNARGSRSRCPGAASAPAHNPAERGPSRPPSRTRSARRSGAPSARQAMVGGEEGIRTPGSLPASTVFKTAALNHSATSPRTGLYRKPAALAIVNLRRSFTPSFTR